jgi:hypothetical protein
MQKLSVKSIAMLYKSCIFIYRETNKFGFAFFWFFCEFLGILQDPEKNMHYLRFGFA